MRCDCWVRGDTFDDDRLLELMPEAALEATLSIIRNLVRVLHGALSDSSIRSFACLFMTASSSRSCKRSTDDVGFLIRTESLYMSVNSTNITIMAQDARTLSLQHLSPHASGLHGRNNILASQAYKSVVRSAAQVARTGNTCHGATE